MTPPPQFGGLRGPGYAAIVRGAMTRQHLIAAAAFAAGQLLQPYVFRYLIEPAGRAIERSLRKRLYRWPRLVRFVTKPR